MRSKTEDRTSTSQWHPLTTAMVVALSELLNPPEYIGYRVRCPDRNTALAVSEFISEEHVAEYVDIRLRPVFLDDTKSLLGIDVIALPLSYESDVGWTSCDIPQTAILDLSDESYQEELEQVAPSEDIFESQETFGILGERPPDAEYIWVWDPDHSEAVILLDDPEEVHKHHYCVPVGKPREGYQRLLSFHDSDANRYQCLCDRDR